MKRPVPANPALVLAVATALLSTAIPAAAQNGYAAPTTEDVEDARRCAAETRVAGYAFREVRDSVRAGGTSRALALLSIADDALADARMSCRGNAEVSAQLDLLGSESDGLRRALGGAER